MLNKIYYNKLFSIKQIYCKYLIKKNKELYNEILSFKKNDISKHVSWITIYQLYNYIINHKPKKILELGSGLSTVVILIALKHICQKYPKYKPIFISMENEKKFFLNTRKKLPKHNKIKTKLIFSKIIKDNYLIFSGYRYLKTPRYDYDFIFVDGPNYNDKNGMSCSFDIIYILSNFSKKFDCLIEKRVGTSYIMQKILGRKSVKLSIINRTTFVKANSINLKTKLDSRVFFKSVLNFIYFKGYY